MIRRLTLLALALAGCGEADEKSQRTIGAPAMFGERQIAENSCISIRKGEELRGVVPMRPNGPSPLPRNADGFLILADTDFRVCNYAWEGVRIYLPAPIIVKVRDAARPVIIANWTFDSDVPAVHEVWPWLLLLDPAQ